MDTVSLLNHYRLFLANDPIAFRVLSYCFANGPSTEQDIQSADLKPAEIKSQIVKLFRANFLQSAGESRWATTELSNALLSKMGVARRAMEWLVESTTLDRDDRDFLKASIRLADEENFWASSRTHEMCFMLLNAFEEIKDEEAIDEKRNETLFSAIVGLDPRAEALGAQGYVDAIESYLPFSARAKRMQLVGKVEVSLRNANASNRILVTADGGSGKSALVLTWVRLLTAARSGRPDVGMECIASHASKKVDEVWSSLKAWKRDLTPCSSRLLFIKEKDDSKNADRLLLTQLKSALESLMEQQTSLPGSRTKNFDYFIDQAWARSPQQSASALVGILRDALEKSQFELLDTQAKKRLCESLEECALLYRQTLLPSEDNKRPNKAVNRSRRKRES